MTKFDDIGLHLVTEIVVSTIFWKKQLELLELSTYYDISVINGKGPRENKTVAGKMKDLENVATEFLPYIQENIESCREENRSF